MRKIDMINGSSASNCSEWSSMPQAFW